MNPQEVQKIWSRLLRILERDGAGDQTSGCFYLEKVKTVLLFGAETWFVTMRIMQLMGGLHHRVKRRILGVNAWYQEEGNCEYSPLEEDIQAVALGEM